MEKNDGEGGFTNDIYTREEGARGAEIPQILDIVLRCLYFWLVIEEVLGTDDYKYAKIPCIS